MITGMDTDAKLCSGCDRKTHGAHVGRCRECCREGSSTYARLRQQALDCLGGACARCGFSDRRALTIDHVNGGGGAERAQQRNGLVFLRRVIAGDLDVQLLCWNCNHIKRMENGEHGRPRCHVTVVPESDPRAVAAREWAAGGWRRVARRSNGMTPEQVAARDEKIRALLDEGLSQRETAKRLGVSQSLVSHVAHGRPKKPVRA